MLKASAILDTLWMAVRQGNICPATNPPGWNLPHMVDVTAGRERAQRLGARTCPAGGSGDSRNFAGAPRSRNLPGLWTGDEITAKAVADYFSGSTVVQVERDGYQEPMQIPKAAQSVVDKAISAAVESGILWLLSGPASILANQYRQAY